MAERTPGQDLFPPPPQPHFIRAQQKDELYLQLLTDACHDAVRRVLGPRGALRWAGETWAAAHLLYHALTTGSGLQTLGEEYCDILQVAGPAGRGMPPGTARRGLLVLLQSAGPYVADRLAQMAVPSGEEDEEESSFAAWRQAQAATPAAAAVASSQERQGLQAHAEQQAVGYAPLLLQRAAEAARQLRRAAQRGAQPVARHLPAAAAFLRDHGATLLRVHLALFYIFGVYYQTSKRAAGVRYLFLGRAFEGRPSYRVLGLLLCTQLGVSGLMWLARRYRLGAMGHQGGAEGAAALRLRHAVLLSEEGKPLPDGGGWGSGPGVAAAAASPAVVASASRKCPLCLSARSHPTATPCGHVFCWQCIAEWGNQKPECPLCRADFTPSSLVCLQHADF